MSLGRAHIINEYVELRERLRGERERRTVVCTIGSWDMLHRGHTEYLEKAGALGDIMVVGVDSDLAYQRYKKRPVIYPQQDRQEIVSSLRHVDYVTIVDDVDLSGEWQFELVKAIQPDVFVCNERSYSVEQRKKLAELCPIRILPFHVPDTASSSAVASEQIKSVFYTQFYSCFISYSSTDQEFAEHLHADLQNQGVRSWFAPEDLKIGDPFQQRIEEAICRLDKLLLVLSERSVQSTWVEKEVETAFEEERRRKTTVLFPIRLDDALMQTNQAWAADIRRTRHIGDFRKWKHHHSYQKAFARLLRDLQADGPTASE